MAFSYLKNMPLEEAQAEYEAYLQDRGFHPSTEMVPVTKSYGRVTSEAVYATLCSPHYHAAAMDGIAVHATDTFGATTTTPVILEESQFVTVDTGDPLPEGYDAVIMVEELIPEGAGMKLHASATPWQHIRQIGEDICAGEMIVPSFSTISPAMTGAFLAGGVLEVEVFKKPRVGILPTGDEVVAPSDNPPKGAVMEFNSSIFTGMVEEYGASAKVYPITKDSFSALESVLKQAISECDIILLNAGSSAGRDDLSVEVISAVGEVFAHGIAIKPGKPTILGNSGNKPVIGIPGYPVSGIIVMEEFVMPLLRKLGGIAEPNITTIEARLSRRIMSSLKYKEYVRVRLGEVESAMVATPLDRGAGVINSFVKADGMLEIPQDREGYEAGDLVTVKALTTEENLRETLVVTGSHDPLIDELANLLRIDDHEATLASSHVGSMGAIMAARRREMHFGGIHLLDGETGAYNESYIEHYFPQGGVYQIECVERVQGLMVAPGNPLDVKDISSLTKEGLRYINRQKGSGTRILCDHLCAQADIDSSQIYGYDHEELTHTAVAAQIAADSADAGMGILSAAQLYGLDFVPLYLEQYDLLVPDYAWELPLLQKVIDIMKSVEFRQRLEGMGGYELHTPGAIRRHY